MIARAIVIFRARMAKNVDAPRLRKELRVAHAGLQEKQKCACAKEKIENLNFTSRASAMVFAVGAAEGEPCEAVCAA